MIERIFPTAQEDQIIEDDPVTTILRRLDVDPMDAIARAQMLEIQKAVFARDMIKGIPPLYVDAALDNWKTPTQRHENILGSIRRYCDYVNAKPDESLGLILHGIPGDGKTHAAIGILKVICSRRRKGVFLDMTALADELRREYDDDGRESPGDIVGDTSNTPIALIDDLGRERLTSDVYAKLTHIVGSRYRSRKLTIITSNLLWPAEFNRRFGAALVSRLTESCRAIRMPDIDFRTERIDQ